MKIIIREHNGYTEFMRAMEEAKKKKIKLPIKQYFGQLQYIFHNKKGAVSLVQLYDLFTKKWFWEIGVFDKKGKIKDVERFGSNMEAAQKRIWEILK